MALILKCNISTTTFRLVEHHGKGSKEKVRAEEEVECCGTLLPRHKDISYLYKDRIF